MANDAHQDPLLYAASIDVDVIEVLSEDDFSKFSSAISYHCQQAAEKMIKVVFHTMGVEHPGGHDIRTLLYKCMDNGWLTPTDEELEAADILTTSEASSRYESAINVDDALAKEAVISCNTIANLLERSGYDAVFIPTKMRYARDDMGVIEPANSIAIP